MLTHSRRWGILKWIYGVAVRRAIASARQNPLHLLQLLNGLSYGPFRVPEIVRQTRYGGPRKPRFFVQQLLNAPSYRVGSACRYARITDEISEPPEAQRVWAAWRAFEPRTGNVESQRGPRAVRAHVPAPQR